MLWYVERWQLSDGEREESRPESRSARLKIESLNNFNKKSFHHEK
ncbi:hypothetical protein M7I_7717 [Glarea lozoyensis 74030]|uniref:Uncharacterized protein n=1 Tax=Glarea lozoyensis (strain ATCC 74030 / MF5533) TaxID=1104152 RepID=H0EY21_GLAL7|nr:hypothetical protein M7I_7717 [Glarea lozoyensis 74030]